MKIALIGYGATGKVISQLAPELGAEISELFTSEHKFTDSSNVEADVIIDFSTASAVVGNVEKAAEYGKSIVIGATGWNNSLGEVKSIVDNSGIGCVFGANFSVGANLFFRIVRESCSIIESAGNFDISISEVHHRFKADSPSGTALRLAHIILERSASKKSISTGNLNRKIESDELHISSLRYGAVPGKHIVSFDGETDTIELTHSAKNRNGFASGAMLAASWIAGKKGIYDFSEHFLLMVSKTK